MSIALHKPKGYICSTEREYPDAKIISDLLPEELRMLKNPPLRMAGRLDKDVTGLLVLSQDCE